MRPLLILALLAAPLALAQKLTADEIARVQHAESKAMDKVAKKYGNRKPSEMSSSERREMIRDQQAALEEAQRAHGVDAKDYARAVAKLPPAERKAVAEKVQALAEKEKAAKQPATDEGVEILEGLDESQVEQLDEEVPEGEVQILTPGGTEEEEVPVE